MDKTTVQDALTHLSALGFVEGDTVLMNCLPIDGGKGKTSKKLSFVYPDVDYLGISQQEAKQLNIFYCPNRAYKDKDVTQSYVLFYEHDDISKEESMSIWQRYGLPEPTIQVDTGGKSVHSYYVLSTPVDPKQWILVQTMLVNVLKADTKLVNPARLMRLAGGVHPKTGYVSTIAKHTGYTYTLDELAKPLEQHYQPIAPTTKTKPSKVKATKPESELLDEVKSALMAINSSQYLDDEDGWHKVGMALKATSESLFDDWVRWSEQSPKSAKCNFAYRWSQWQGEGYQGGYTYKSIFRWAYDCGWRSTNAKYLPSPSGTWEHLDPTPETPPQQRSAFGAMVDRIYNAIGNKLSYNSFTCRLIYEGQERMADYVSIQIQDTLNIDIPRRLFDSKEVVKAVAQRNQFHPILDYLNSCKPKDGVSHLNVATKYLGATEAVEDEYFAAFLKAAVLRQINTTTPTEYHFILVLLGATGCGKTSTFKLLFKTWYYDMKSFNGSEWKEGVAKSWLCFWDEMSPVLGNKKHAEINGFITQSQDFYHELYETKAKLRIRPFVIGGTTTECEFLSENPSLRRFNVVKMKALDRVAFERDVDAIWASAYADALANPTMQEVSTFAAIEKRNKEFVRPSDYNSIIARLVDQQYRTMGYVRPDEVVEAAVMAKIPIPKDFGNSVDSYLDLHDDYVRARPYTAERKRIRAWIRK